MTDYQAQVDELMADYRRSREQLASVHRDLAAIRSSAVSADRTVTATVGPQGALVELRLTEDAYRRHAPAALADLVVRTTTEAAGKAAALAQQVLAPVLPSDSDPAAVLAGRADLTAQEVAVPEVAAGPRRVGPDDDEFAERSWMQDGTPGRVR